MYCHFAIKISFNKKNLDFFFLPKKADLLSGCMQPQVPPPKEYSHIYIALYFGYVGQKMKCINILTNQSCSPLDYDGWTVKGRCLEQLSDTFLHMVVLNAFF